MPGHARQRCESEIYHILMRGINRDDIFLDDKLTIEFKARVEIALTSKRQWMSKKANHEENS